MPDGQTHTVTNLFVLAGLGVAYQRIAPHEVARRNWGMLGVIWYPLGLVVNHRGMTHTYLRGSTSLLLYAAVMLSVLLYGGWR